MKRKAEEDSESSKRPRTVPKLEIGNNYAELYRAALAEGSDARLELFQKVNDEENVYREMFAQERESAGPIQDAHLMMVDPHKYEDIFTCPTQDAHEEALPRVFKLPSDQKRPAGASSIVSKKEFLRNFDVFTESQLRFLDWNNVLIAGGSVLACLQPVPESHNKNNRTRREYFHKVAYKSSDVDLFIYGLGEEEANKKLNDIYEALQESIPAEAIAFRSQHAITIVSQYPYRHIQVVLRLYKSPAEILMGFDVDSCAVGFDGERVLVMPRAHRALTHQYNTIDMSRRSPSYEMRLAKYSERGFEVLVPSLSPSKVDPQIFERRFDQLQGLAKLLVLEKLDAPEYRTKYKQQQRMRRLRPPAQERVTFWSGLDSTFNDEWSRERLQGAANASDYSTVFLPWGPKWNASRVRKLMYTKDMILNSKWFDPKKKIHTHPCFFGTINEVVKDCCGQCPPVPPDAVDPDSPFVSGRMEWVTVDPGAQRIGSFHPITEGDWTEGAYIHGSMEKLALAVNADDLPAITQLLHASTEEVDLDARDGVGRTLLHLAVLSGSTACAKFLIDRKVRIGAKMCDGRNALHLAAQYGRDEIVPLLLARAKVLKKEAEQKKKDKEEAAEEEEEMEEDEDEDGEEVDEEFCIRAIVERKKKDEAAAAAEPALEDDTLDVDEKDWDMSMSALHFAIFFGSNRIIPLLLEAGAALEPASVNQNQTITPLALCIFNSQLATARLLLARGANVDERDHRRRTPLHLAAEAANIELVRLLCSEGAHVDVFDKSFRTPLNALLSSHRPRNADEGEEADDAGEAIPPHQLAVLRCLVEEFDAAVSYSKEHLPSSAEQQQFGMSIGGHFWGQTPSDQAQLRSGLEQPLHQAVNLRSVGAVTVLLRRIARLGRDTSAHLNWISSSRQTPLDVATQLIEFFTKDSSNWQVQHHMERKESLEKQLASVKRKKGQELLQHEVESQLAEVDIQLQGLVDEKAAEANEVKCEQVRRVKRAIEAAGGKAFHSMKLPARDRDLAEYQQRTSHTKQGRARDDVTLSFQSLREGSAGQSFAYPTAYDEKGQRRYHDLFNAIFNKDVPAVRKLLNKRVGEQAHACSMIINGKTSLQLAAFRGGVDLVSCLLEAAKAQFTPLATRRRKEAEGGVSINNHDLARLMNHVKPGEYLRSDGTALAAEYEAQDQNEAVMQLNCVVSPSTYIGYTDNHNRNVLHYCAAHGHVDVLQAIASFCTDNDLADRYYKDTPDEKRPALLSEMLQRRDRSQLTPFELAVACGEVAAAKALLGLGGAHAVAADAAGGGDESAEYAGLDVGGKKMDWALEHHASGPAKTFTRGALHVAAQYKQADAAQFLLESGAALWKKYLRSVDALEDEAVEAAARHFSLASVDDKGNTPLHYAAGRGHDVVLQTMLERASDEDVNRRNASGVTALHMAAASGHLSCASHLLTWRARAGEVDERRGWTPLHFACMADHSKVVRLLLRFMSPGDTSALSNKFKQSAAVVAAYYGSAASLKALKASPKGGCDVAVADVCGDTALFHAVKQQKLDASRALLADAPPEHLAVYRRENGVGLTVVDCARLRLVAHLKTDHVPSHSAAILDLVTSKIGEEREVARTADVRNVTYIMLGQAQVDAEQEMAQAAERSRCYWRYKPDDTEVEGQTHGGDISVPSYTPIPR